MSLLKVNNITDLGDDPVLTDGVLDVTPPAILQIVSTTKTDTFSTTSTSFTPLTGLSVSITPSSATSKILVTCDLSYGMTQKETRGKFRFMRNATPIGIGDAAGTRQRATGAFQTGDVGDASASDNSGNSSSSFLDAPGTTSALTYSIDVMVQQSTIFINRNSNDPNSTAPQAARRISTITLMEVAG